jgi:hypothetical protein
MTTILDLVKLDDDARLKLKLLDIREKIIDKAKQVIHIYQTVTDKQFIKYICELIEVTIKKSFKCDKLQFLFLVLNGLSIQITEEQKLQITGIVEHLVSRKEIRLIPIIERAWAYANLILVPVGKAFFYTGY